METKLTNLIEVVRQTKEAERMGLEILGSYSEAYGGE